MAKNVTFSSARYNLDFASGVVNVNGVVQHNCCRAMSVSSKRLSQFILDLIRCRDWYGLADKYVLDRDESCDIFGMTKATDFKFCARFGHG